MEKYHYSVRGAPGALKDHYGDFVALCSFLSIYLMHYCLVHILFKRPCQV